MVIEKRRDCCCCCLLFHICQRHRVIFIIFIYKWHLKLMIPFTFCFLFIFSITFLGFFMYILKLTFIAQRKSFLNFDKLWNLMYCDDLTQIDINSKCWSISFFHVILLVLFVTAPILKCFYIFKTIYVFIYQQNKIFVRQWLMQRINMIIFVFVMCVAWGWQ